MKYIILIVRLCCIAGILSMNFLTAELKAQNCPVPSNLHIINLQSTSGLLVWNSVNAADGYVVRFKPVNSNSWRRQPTLNNSELITGLIPNTTYEAKVRSDCANEEGNYTQLYHFITPSNNPCNLPNVYYFTSDNIQANSCLVGWPAVSNATGYNVRYKIRFSISPWLLDSTSSNSLLLSSLSPSTQYEFQVQTRCNSGSAQYSYSGIFTTVSGSCGSPSNLSANNVTIDSAVLSWSAQSCASYYIVNYRQSGQSWITDSSANSNYQLSALTPATGYEFYVQSVDTDGIISNPSQFYSFTTGSNTCGVPTNLTTSALGTNTATLDWSGVSGSVNYIIRYRLAGAMSWQVDSSTSSNLVVTGLSPDNAYEFQVQSTCALSTGSFSAMATFLTLPNASNNIPIPDHIVICILENKSYSQLFGGTLTPHINALANDSMSAVFTESYAITHPSQPNYLQLYSGSNQGVTGDSKPGSHFTTANLGRELLNVGQTFIGYNEGLPSAGFDGSTSGSYARKHNPVSNWMGTGANQVPATLNQPFTAFPSNYDNLPTVSFVSPDMNNSMHDGSLATALVRGDNWVYNNLNGYIQWAKTHNSLFILTTDEDDGSHGNRILTIVTGEMVNGGSYAQPITHYSVLRTIEEMYGLNFIGASANATSIHGIWTNGFRKASQPEAIQVTPKTEEHIGWKVYPNPSHGEIHAAFNLDEEADVTIRIYSYTGSLIFEKKLGPTSKGEHVYDVPTEDKRIPAGAYFVDISYGTKKFVQRFLVSQ